MSLNEAVKKTTSQLEAIRAEFTEQKAGVEKGASLAIAELKRQFDANVASVNAQVKIAHHKCDVMIGGAAAMLQELAKNSPPESPATEEAAG